MKKKQQQAGQQSDPFLRPTPSPSSDSQPLSIGPTGFWTALPRLLQMEELLDRLAGIPPVPIQKTGQPFRASGKTCIRMQGDPDKLKAFAELAREMHAGRESLQGMDKGRLSRADGRRERTKAEVRDIQRFIYRLRKRFPSWGMNDMIRETVRECRVSKSFIDRHRRDKTLVIPPATK